MHFRAASDAMSSRALLAAVSPDTALLAAEDALPAAARAASTPPARAFVCRHNTTRLMFEKQNMLKLEPSQ